MGVPPESLSEKISQWTYFPEDQGQIDNEAGQKFHKDGNQYILELSKPDAGWPEFLNGILASKEGWDAQKHKGLKINMKIE